MTDFIFSRVRVFVEHGVNRYNDARCTEAALQTMFFQESLLNGVQIAIHAGHAFNGSENHAIGLYGQHETGAHSFAIEKDGTATADTMFAADVCPCQVKFMAEKI